MLCINYLYDKHQQLFEQLIVNKRGSLAIDSHRLFVHFWSNRSINMVCCNIFRQWHEVHNEEKQCYHLFM